MKKWIYILILCVLGFSLVGAEELSFGYNKGYTNWSTISCEGKTNYQRETLYFLERATEYSETWTCEEPNGLYKSDEAKNHGLDCKNIFKYAYAEATKTKQEWSNYKGCYPDMFSKCTKVIKEETFYSYSITYTITYNANGGTVTPSSKNFNYTYLAWFGEIPTPTRSGYRFVGWYTKANGGDYVSYYSLLDASNVTIYAHWTNVYTVIFDSNGGSGSMSNQSMTYDEAQNLTSNSFTKTGYTFKGWNTKADGTGESYNDGESVKNLVSTSVSTITLYAQWEQNSVYYKTDCLIDSKNVIVGTNITVEPDSSDKYIAKPASKLDLTQTIKENENYKYQTIYFKLDATDTNEYEFCIGKSNIEKASLD